MLWNFEFWESSSISSTSISASASCFHCKHAIPANRSTTGFQEWRATRRSGGCRSSGRRSRPDRPHQKRRPQLPLGRRRHSSRRRPRAAAAAARRTRSTDASKGACRRCFWSSFYCCDPIRIYALILLLLLLRDIQYLFMYSIRQ
jgi:hypothetical protein